MSSGSLADGLAGAVSDLLAALGQPLSDAARLPFDRHERRDWAYWPTARPGVAIGDLDRAQTKAVHRLLARVVPLPTLAQVTTIMGLEEVLDAVEGHERDDRHRDDYWLMVFGEPGSPTWGWRFEGHHVSIHVTVVDGEVALTPHFLGANPAVVHDAVPPAGDAGGAGRAAGLGGGRAGASGVDGAGGLVVAPLVGEEQAGFELLHALTVEQRSAAMLSDEAPADIVTRNRPAVDGSPGGVGGGGVPLDALSGEARRAADELLSRYLGRFPPGVRVPDPAGAVFAWAGADQPGIGHYYRVWGPRLVIELDNTQNGANHVHTVVRDPEGDFGGGDPLAEHHRLGHS